METRAGSGAANARWKPRGRRDERTDAAAQALVTAGKSLRRLARAFFAGNGAIEHSDTRNTRSPRLIGRISGWRRRDITRRRCRGRHRFCGRGWHTCWRDWRIRRWRCFCPLPPLARFSAVQDDAAIFSYARPAGLQTMFLQQFRDHRIRCPLAAQFHNGVMERFQSVKRNAMRIRPKFLNGLAQRFKIGSRLWCGWRIHNF